MQRRSQCAGSILLQQFQQRFFHRRDRATHDERRATEPVRTPDAARNAADLLQYGFGYAKRQPDYTSLLQSRHVSIFSQRLCECTSANRFKIKCHKIIGMDRSVNTVYGVKPIRATHRPPIRIRRPKCMDEFLPVILESRVSQCTSRHGSAIKSYSTADI